MFNKFYYVIGLGLENIMTVKFWNEIVLELYTRYTSVEYRINTKCWEKPFFISSKPISANIMLVFYGIITGYDNLLPYLNTEWHLNPRYNKCESNCLTVTFWRFNRWTDLDKIETADSDTEKDEGCFPQNSSCGIVISKFSTDGAAATVGYRNL